MIQSRSEPRLNQPDAALPEIKRAYATYTAEVRVRNSKVACALVMALMPAGFVLDSFVYHEARWQFLGLRFIASALAFLVLLGLRRPNLAGWQSRLLCMGWYVLPAFFISWMIGATDGYTSAYYAGLNLVILAVSSVIQATLQESIIAVGLVLFMFVAACLLHPVLNPSGRVFYSYTSQQSLGMLVNNWYFMLLTSTIVVTGNFFFNRLRFREFALRFELDRNRKALEESNRKMMELDQIKSRFFANISHELRTPLTLLLAPLETLLHRFNRSFDDDTRQVLATMHSNGMRLLKLINDLLDLVRLESGRMEVKQEPLELAEFVKGLASSSARQVADDKRLQIWKPGWTRGLGAVLADRDKLEKVVLNLVFNALKFTPAGGKVEIRAEKQGEQFVLIVADTGMGISAKNLPHVFDRFWQADGSSKRKYQGVGIGLALVKELVEIQGGTVTVQSREGQGTTFTARMPYRRARSARARSRPSADAGRQWRRHSVFRGMAGQSVSPRGTVPRHDAAAGRAQTGGSRAQREPAQSPRGGRRAGHAAGF